MKNNKILLILFLIILSSLNCRPNNTGNFDYLEDGKLCILAIGNSFSEDAIENYLYELCKAKGIEAVIGNMYIPGCTLETHWKNVEEGKSPYSYRKIYSGNRRTTANVALQDVILDERWDIITFQQASGISGIYSTYDPYLENLIAWCKENSDAQLWWHQTWAYSQDSTHPEFINYEKDQMGMYNAIIDAVKKTMYDHSELVDLIPSGTAIQNMRTSYIGDSLTRDGYHLETTYGRYTAACTWFEKLTGIDVRDNSFYPSAIDLRLKDTTQRAAHAAILNPYEITKITEIINPTDILLNVDTLNLSEGDTYQLEATVSPEGTTDKTVVWSSSNENIVLVSEAGLVTAISAGLAIITASCGKVSASCEITVNKPIIEAESIILNITSAELYINDTLQLEVTVLPDNTTDKTLTWHSSTNDVATVNEFGLISAISEGTSTITVTCGQESATCRITVLNPIIDAEFVVLNYENAEITVGETFQLEADVLPEDTTDKTIYWRSSNKEIITVSEYGMVAAISVGNADIIATCGDVSAICKVMVNPVKPSEIYLSANELTMTIGETENLTATVYPENTTYKTVSWKSEDELIAKVSSDGTITAISAGETIIEASCGEISTDCVITVIEVTGFKSLLADPETEISIYSTDGILLKNACKVKDLKSLAKGIYIIYSGQDRYRIII